MGNDPGDTPPQRTSRRAQPTVTPAPSRSFPIPVSRKTAENSSESAAGSRGGNPNERGGFSEKDGTFVHEDGTFGGASSGSSAPSSRAGRVAHRGNVTRRTATPHRQASDGARYYRHADADYPVPGVRVNPKDLGIDHGQGRGSVRDSSRAGTRDADRLSERYCALESRPGRAGERYPLSDQDDYRPGERYTPAGRQYPQPGERATRPRTSGRRRASSAGAHSRTAPGRASRPRGVHAASHRPYATHRRSSQGYSSGRNHTQTHITRAVRAIQHAGYAVADWGWKTWAVSGACVLAMILVVSMVVNQGTPSDTTTATTADVAASSHTTQAAATSTVARAAEVVDEELPAGGPFTEAGQGTYRTIGQPGAQVGQGTAGVITYTIEVENGLNSEDYGGDDAVATMIDQTLADPKSWTKDPQFAFRHVGDGEEPRLRIQLSSPQTTHTNCGYSIKIETSCFTSAGNRVILNESRWIRGSSMFDGDLTGYRQYMINHEVGHGIGYGAHVPCLEDGALAPIMMQQTLSLANSPMHYLDEESSQVYPDDHKICRPNPWPYPVEA